MKNLMIILNLGIKILPYGCALDGRSHSPQVLRAMAAYLQLFTPFETYELESVGFITSKLALSE
ncbi:MAG: hypothetical protein L3J28_07155 [Candidatus Polarisedimenticolaceae bacterium]|nr:hypothetical protein [Candidatus Polarisedimenticolaceae bacterium]